MTSHLKRIASPRTWRIDRKQFIFTVKPSPGAHAKEMGLPLGVLMRDTLRLGAIMGEVRKILNNKNILVDGRRKKDHRFNVGLFDVLTIGDLNKHYRMFIDENGFLTLREINAAESKVKVGKVIGKRILPKGKVQYNLYDGKNFLSTEKIKVGDSVVLSLPKSEVTKVLPLKAGMTVFLTKGKHCGDVGILKQIKGDQAVYVTDGKEVETAKAYLFVVGEKEPVIQLKK
ncbi:30S ribosomal protein S4e [Candidatus Woesearchaeota archaeon]|nr:30S ribosomal protein S4e [Candidatus Woesearchaeota archaeon]